MVAHLNYQLLSADELPLSTNAILVTRKKTPFPHPRQSITGDP